MDTRRDGSTAVYSHIFASPIDGLLALRMAESFRSSRTYPCSPMQRYVIFGPSRGYRVLIATSEFTLAYLLEEVSSIDTRNTRCALYIASIHVYNDVYLAVGLRVDLIGKLKRNCIQIRLSNAKTKITEIPFRGSGTKVRRF